MIDVNSGDFDSYLAKLVMNLRNVKNDDEECFKTIVNAPFFDKLMTTQLGLGVIVLLLNNPHTKTIDRIALSDTDHAKGAENMSAKPFREIRIPNDHADNLIVQAVDGKSPKHTTDWLDLFTPELSLEDARFNQAGAGIECSFIYPLSNVNDGGALIFSYFIMLEKINEPQKRFMKMYTEAVSDTLRNSLTYKPA